jgi:predicted acetyltransferase
VRFGERELPGVVLSPVGTLPAYRGRGIAEEVLRFGLALVKEKGYVFSTVLGHTSFYPRVGYVPVFSWYRASKGIEKLEGVAAAAVREVQERDLAMLAALYEQEMAGHLFYPTRSTEWFARELEAAGKAGHLFLKKANVLVFEREGRVVAYAHVGENEDKLIVQECCLESFEQAASVYQALMELADTRGKQGLDCPFPLVTAFGVFFKMQGPQVTVHAPSAWMMQVIDWDKWMDAHVARYGTEDLKVRVEVEEPFQKSSPVSLHVQRGEHSHVYETSSLPFTQLMMGRYTLQDLLLAGAVRLPVETVVALGSLFPKQGAYFNIGDALF